MFRVLGFFTAFFVLASLLLLGHFSGMMKIPVLEKQLSELEAECVVAAMHSDARWAGDVDLAVRREVGLTILRHARAYKRDVCDVFSGGLTLIPEGYHRAMPYFRSVRYIRLSLEATEASWKSDMQLVSELMKEPLTGCATQYARKHRLSDWLAQPQTAREAMRLSMRPVGHAREGGKEVGAAEFFCPR